MENNFQLLLATDYSDAAKSAEQYAIHFAKNTRSSLAMVHVYNEMLNDTGKLPLDYIRIKNDVHDVELKIIERHSLLLFQALNVKKEDVSHECFVHEGNVVNEVIEEAKDICADFIIVGAHGVSGLRRILLGKHAWGIAQKSHVPVLAIPANAKFNGIKKIVFATEEEEDDIETIRFLVNIAEAFDAELTLLHIAGTSISPEYDTTMFKKFKNKIKGRIFYEKMDLWLVHYEDVITGLDDFCIRTNTDLLVMASEKKTLWEKIFFPDSETIKKMSFYTHIPLLTMPAFAVSAPPASYVVYEMDEKRETAKI